MIGIDMSARPVDTPDASRRDAASGRIESASLLVVAPGAQVDFGRQVHALLGLPFDAVDLRQACDRVAGAALAGRRCFLSTPNVNFLIAARRDESFRHSVLHSDLSVIDGMPIVWWGRRLGVPLRERVAGADLFARLAATRWPRRLRVYFFGGPPGVAERASEHLTREAVGLEGAGGHSPGFASLESMTGPEHLERINASRADIVLVALGAQKGQAWIDAARAALDPPVVSHLGAVVNFVAGTVRRAPGWTQSAGLEWVWRIVQEPGLWRRYWNDGWALLRLLSEGGLTTWRYLRLVRRVATPPDGRTEISEAAGVTVLRLRGDWSRGDLVALRQALAEVARRGLPARVVFGADASVGTEALGLLLLLSGFAREAGFALSVEAVSARLARVLTVNGLAASLVPGPSGADQVA